MANWLLNFCSYLHFIAIIMSQNEQVKALLLSGKKITRLECLYKFGGINLPARIYDLEKEGMTIDRKKVCLNGKYFNQYFINFKS
jgi:hypothetical protein